MGVIMFQHIFGSLVSKVCRVYRRLASLSVIRPFRVNHCLATTLSGLRHGIDRLRHSSWAHHGAPLPIAGELFYVRHHVDCGTVKVFNWISTMWRGGEFRDTHAVCIGFLILF